MILGATDKKLWVFEVFGQGLARVGMCWSQPARVDYLLKKWRAGTPGQFAPVPFFFEFFKYF
jgi:hypothetical protein